jgi:hypothetical protein
MRPPLPLVLRPIENQGPCPRSCARASWAASSAATSARRSAPSTARSCPRATPASRRARWGRCPPRRSRRCRPRTSTRWPRAWRWCARSTTGCAGTRCWPWVPGGGKGRRCRAVTADSRPRAEAARRSLAGSAGAARRRSAVRPRWRVGAGDGRPRARLLWDQPSGPHPRRGGPDVWPPLPVGAHAPALHGSGGTGLAAAPPVGDGVPAGGALSPLFRADRVSPRRPLRAGVPGRFADRTRPEDDLGIDDHASSTSSIRRARSWPCSATPGPSPRPAAPRWSGSISTSGPSWATSWWPSATAVRPSIRASRAPDRGGGRGPALLHRRFAAHLRRSPIAPRAYADDQELMASLDHRYRAAVRSWVARGLYVRLGGREVAQLPGIPWRFPPARRRLAARPWAGPSGFGAAWLAYRSVPGPVAPPEAGAAARWSRRSSRTSSA